MVSQTASECDHGAALFKIFVAFVSMIVRVNPDIYALCFISVVFWDVLQAYSPPAGRPRPALNHHALV